MKRASLLRLCGIYPFLAPILILLLQPACDVSSGRNDGPFGASFPPVVPLTAAEAESIIEEGALSIDASTLIVAVVDRVGRPLAVWSRDPAASDDDLNIAVSIARTGAFMSSSQGPISSRTLEFISTFHFPPTFGDLENPEIVDDDPTITSLGQRRQTTGINFTPQGPLWQIFSCNRGAPLAGPGLTLAETGEETLFNPGMEIPPPGRIDGTFPGPGLTYQPGGIPLYKAGRLVGAVGCYVPDPVTGDANPAAQEFAAITAASSAGFAFQGIPTEGAIFLVGILLPYVEQTVRPAGFAAGTSSMGSGTFADIDPLTVGLKSRAGIVDPFGYLIGPRADPLGEFTLADVERIVDNSVAGANGTRAAIRLPIGTSTKMFIVVTNLDGLILALFRMEDAPIFSMDVSTSKARNVTYFSSADGAAEIPFLPAGTAVTNRTLGFLTQPFYPPGIDTANVEGPLFESLAVLNQDPAQFDRQGNQVFRPGLQNGIIFFPGSAPLYNSSGDLIGGLGVSGDGVEEDDYVTFFGFEGFEAPLEIRADQFFYQNVRLPYLKFPQNPGTDNP